jgi:hypothetical protein
LAASQAGALTHAEAVVYCPECAEREFGVNLLDEGG